MRPVKVLRSTDQLTLFHLRTATPAWLRLPPEVRQQALALLARLLRQHRRQLLGVLPRGVRHE